MLNVAVNEVSLWTFTLLAVTPPELIFTTVPEPERKFTTPDLGGRLKSEVLKLVPVIVTVTFVPLNPLEGEIDVTVGVGRPTLNFTALLVPRELVTVTSCEAGGASGATVNVTVMVSSVTEGPLKVTPEPVIPTVVTPALQDAPPPPTNNPLPVRVTW